MKTKKNIFRYFTFVLSLVKSKLSHLLSLNLTQFYVSLFPGFDSVWAKLLNIAKVFSQFWFIWLIFSLVSTLLWLSFDHLRLCLDQVSWFSIFLSFDTVYSSFFWTQFVSICLSSDSTLTQFWLNTHQIWKRLHLIWNFLEQNFGNFDPQLQFLRKFRISRPFISALPRDLAQQNQL